MRSPLRTPKRASGAAASTRTWPSVERSASRASCWRHSSVCALLLPARAGRDGSSISSSQQARISGAPGGNRRRHRCGTPRRPAHRDLAQCPQQQRTQWQAATMPRTMPCVASR
ncbi:hypothetical protein G6F63_016045 [Rhizopus arrhizus]|nr:hypothetical protein G6F63_016045 [Rhizopus arrhizus]